MSGKNWNVKDGVNEYCALWRVTYMNIKYGNQCTSMGTGTGSTACTGSLYVRSGREKTMNDQESLFPRIGDDSFMGQDYSVIYENLKDVGPSRHYTVVFNTFLWMTIFNFINARKLQDELNVFKGILGNSLFLMIVAIIIVSQVILVTFGGIVFMCYVHGPYYGLTPTQWLICIGFGAGGLVVSFLLKFINEDKIFSKNAGMGNKETNPLDGHSGVLSIKRSQQFTNRM